MLWALLLPGVNVGLAQVVVMAVAGMSLGTSPNGAGGGRRGGGTHLCQHLSQLREAAQAVFGRINPDLGPSDFLK